MITLAVFDMAGTTIEEHGLVYVALQEAVEATGATVSRHDLENWMGRDKVEAITALMEAGGQTPSDERVASAFVDFRNRLHEKYIATPPRALEGVEQAFATLRAQGAKIYLTTGFDASVVAPLLAGLGWADTGVIDGWICTDDVPTGRPAPYMIYRAMEASGTRDVAEVLVAGDTVADIEAGLNARAGLTVAVTTGDVSRETLAARGPSAVLDSLAQVRDLPGIAQ
jgi:phosphonatase-like hydrolase